MPQPPRQISRRDMLRRVGTGLGAVGLARTLAADASSPGPLAVREPHFPAKAKHVIHLFLNGGPAHVDSFDFKPMLDK